MAPVKKTAILSDDKLYRYQLGREWAAKGQCVTFVMVNPSTADADQDDATIRKCLGFAERWGFGRLLVVNLFAYRATDIRDLASVDAPVGHRNTPFIKEAMWAADQVVVAWGPQAKLPRDLRTRWRIVPKLAAELGSRNGTGGPMELACIGSPCKDGHPRHPLMAAYDTPRQWWKPPGG